MAGLPSDTPLTPRRLEVLRLAANGMTNAEIARHLWLSEEAVKSHMQIAYRVLGARDRANAVAIALVRGLLKPHEIQLRPPGTHRALPDPERPSQPRMPTPGPPAARGRPNVPPRHPSSVERPTGAQAPAQAVA